MANNLTQRQHQVLDFVLQRLQNRGLPPTRAEIAAAMGFAVSASAQEHVQALVRKGYIALDAGQSRALTVLKHPDGSAYQHPASTRAVRLKQVSEVRLPIVGSVRAGQPIVAEDHIESYLPVQGTLFKPRADFLLRVRGDSMCDAGILEGDVLAIHKSNVALAGQIVVARVGDDITVKFFQRKDDIVMLVAANANYKPIQIALSDPQFAIEGIVVGVIRHFHN
jgi:repressor LexA